MHVRCKDRQELPKAELLKGQEEIRDTALFNKEIFPDLRK